LTNSAEKKEKRRPGSEFSAPHLGYVPEPHLQKKEGRKKRKREMKLCPLVFSFSLSHTLKREGEERNTSPRGNNVFKAAHPVSKKKKGEKKREKEIKVPIDC